MIELSEDFYFTGLPIETAIGDCHFLTIKDYKKYFIHLQYIGMTKEQIIYSLYESYKGQNVQNEIDELNEYSLFQLVFELPVFNEVYTKLLAHVFNDEDIVSKIDEENFYAIRKLVMHMQCMKEEIINPNPEIQRAIERSKRVKSQGNEKLTLADMASSIVVATGLSYKDINEFTLYQFYISFYRIGSFKNYDTQVLFSTVSTEKIKIDSWSKHIDLFEDEKHFISESEFKKNTGSVFDE